LAAHEEMTRFRRLWPWWRCVLTGLSTLALVLSAFLSWHYLAGGSVIGCSVGSPCDQVFNSRWSAIGGVLPVSGLAMGTYLAMLVAGLFVGPATEASVRRLAWCAMLVIVGAAAGSAVWFIILQKWVIRAFCPYCMTAHITGLFLAVFVIWLAPMQFDYDSPNVTLRRLIGPFPVIGLPMFGLVLAGILAACQVIIPAPAVYNSGQSQTNLPVLDPHNVPLVGSPDANYVVNLLFDYKCPHCQKLHFMLDEVIRRYKGELAFAVCPTPLNTRCNPYIPRDVEEFKDSCELTKLALAVWLADREAFAAFEQWMFSYETGDRWQPRSLDTAEEKAVELVGQAKFDAARADPWIDKYMQTTTRIYGDTGSTAIPKLVFGSLWVTPKPSDANDLVLILQNSLALPSPDMVVNSQ
jgi:uncharacterized membrane protein/protein-disulfide isomerase